jgi:hypothetical protein
MTGVFMYHCEDARGYQGLGTVQTWTEARQIPAADVWNKLYPLVNQYEDCFIPRSVHFAVEKYIITPKTAKLTQQTDALEVTGVMKAMAAEWRYRTCTQYLKANLKFASDDMLKAIGWFNPKMRHANDAARQAFALLKDVDYPHWSELVRDAKMEPTTEG